MTAVDDTRTVGHDPADDARGREGVLERAFDVLRCFSADEPVLSAAEIADRTGIALSSVHRLLAKLVAVGAIEKLWPQRYAIGLGLWKLGELNPLLLELRETALPHMSRLYEATGENVQLAVIDGDSPRTAQVLYIARSVGVSSSPTLTRVGGSFALHTTCVGKALLATQNQAWLAEYIRGGLLPDTTHSITRGEDLLRDLARVRARGYAVTREEMSLGTCAVAASFERGDGRGSAAIGIVTEASRFRERELSAMVMATARRLHTLLADRFDH